MTAGEARRSHPGTYLSGIVNGGVLPDMSRIGLTSVQPQEKYIFLQVNRGSETGCG